MRMNKTKTDGTSVVCFRIHMGAMRPSGCSGEDGVRGDKGECEELYPGSSGRSILRGGNGTSCDVSYTRTSEVAGLVETHLVDEHDLESLGFIGLPDRDLALGDERIVQAHREHIKWVLTLAL